MVAPVLRVPAPMRRTRTAAHVHDCRPGRWAYHEAALAITVHVGAMLAVMAFVALVYEPA